MFFFLATANSTALTLQESLDQGSVLRRQRACGFRRGEPTEDKWPDPCNESSFGNMGIGFRSMIWEDD